VTLNVGFANTFGFVVVEVSAVNVGSLRVAQHIAELVGKRSAQIP